MRQISLSIILGCFSSINSLFAQKVDLTASNLVANQVYLSFAQLEGKKAVRASKDTTVKAADEATFVKVKNLDFQDGVIEVKVLSRLLKSATPTARGFIGVAFRISADNASFECIYLRPTNGRADDQVRRNHSIQYFSFPDHKFDRLRKESPEKYEAYADMGLNEWIKVKIVVSGGQAKLFLHDQKQPSLIVNDLKLGKGISGGVGLFVDVGTEGYFRDLKVVAPR
jgi:hypothetical protein